MKNELPITLSTPYPFKENHGIHQATSSESAAFVLRISHDSLKQASMCEGLETSGVYVLVYQKDGVVRTVFIGSGSNCYAALLNHNSVEEQWDFALVFLANDPIFTKRRLEFLEWSIQLILCQADDLKVLSGIITSRPIVLDRLAKDLENLCVVFCKLASALGFAMPSDFGDLASLEENCHVFIQTRGADAQGYFTSNGFMLLKGSKCNSKSIMTLIDANIRRREVLIEEGVLVKKDTYLLVTVDHLYSSPSEAGAIVMGREINGWQAWKSSYGIPLDEMLRNMPLV